MSSTPQELLESFFVMLSMVMVGLILLFSVSMQWDILDPIFSLAGLYNVPAAWDSSDDRSYLISQIYVIAYALFIIGPAQFIITCVRKQEYDNYVYER